MLVLKRKVNEGAVRLGFDADRSVTIHREEVAARIAAGEVHPLRKRK